MAYKQNNHSIPTLTNLVVAGNPQKKVNSTDLNSKSSHLDELNQRIDEIENAIGQDNSGPVGRAFAIRAETSKISQHRTDVKSEISLQKTK